MFYIFTLDELCIEGSLAANTPGESWSFPSPPLTGGALSLWLQHFRAQACINIP